MVLKKINYAQKLNIIVFFLFLCIKASAQDSIKVTQRGLYRIGFSFSPELISVRQTDIYANGKGKPGFSFGVSFYRPLNEFFGFSTSVQYGYKKFIHSGRFQDSTDVDPVTKSANTSSMENCEVSFHELQIPVSFRCAPVNEKFYINVGLDFVYGLKVQSHTAVSLGNGTSGNYDYSEKGRFNYGILFGLGYQMKMTKSLYLNIEPTMKVYTKDYYFPSYGYNPDGYQLIDYGIKTTLYLNK